jgi:hypothetical protein
LAVRSNAGDDGARAVPPWEAAEVASRRVLPGGGDGRNVGIRAGEEDFEKRHPQVSRERAWSSARTEREKLLVIVEEVAVHGQDDRNKQDRASNILQGHVRLEEDDTPDVSSCRDSASDDGGRAIFTKVDAAGIGRKS